MSEEVAIELGETFEVPVWEVERPSRFPTLGELQQSMRRGFDLYSLEESEVRHVFGDVVEEAFDELDGYSEELDEGVEEHGVGGDEIGMVKIMVRSVVRQSEIRHGLWGVRVSFVVVGEHSGVGRVERERTFDSEVEVSPIGVGCMGEGSAPWCGGSFPRLSPFASELANVEIRNLVAHIDFLRQGQLETFEALGVKIRGDVVKIGAPVSMVVMLLFMVAKYRNAKKTLDVLKRSSWIPVMPGKLPVVLSVLGFVGLPFST
ncbi:MAG: hypothetical protein KC931_22825, partial [Candidatus Omnitrophica bacterium]|nr:hypothetical protein [Candidatus Omnitrophota bacterium]